MRKYLLISCLATSVLAGCSTTQPVAMQEDPYCYTDETIATQNGVVNSSTLVQCSDNPVKRAKLVGVDEKNCRRWERRDYVNGREKHYGGYICRDEKGNWRPLSQF